MSFLKEEEESTMDEFWKGFNFENYPDRDDTYLYSNGKVFQFYNTYFAVALYKANSKGSLYCFHLTLLNWKY